MQVTSNCPASHRHGCPNVPTRILLFVGASAQSAAPRPASGAAASQLRPLSPLHSRQRCGMAFDPTSHAAGRQRRGGAAVSLTTASAKARRAARLGNLVKRCSWPAVAALDLAVPRPRRRIPPASPARRRRHLHLLHIASRILGRMRLGSALPRSPRRATRPLGSPLLATSPSKSKDKDRALLEAPASAYFYTSGASQ